MFSCWSYIFLIFICFRSIPGRDSKRSIVNTKDRIYDQTVVWFAVTFKSSKTVIELKDKELGVIIGNAAVNANISIAKWLPPVNNLFTFKMKVEMKDSKFRMTFNNVKMVTDGFEKPIEDTNRASNEKLMAIEFQKIADSLVEYLSQPKKSDW